jgi:hypothetical protein
MVPLCTIRYICIVGDENIIKMKRMTEAPPKNEQAGQNQAGRDFPAIPLVKPVHVRCAIFARTII